MAKTDADGRILATRKVVLLLHIDNRALVAGKVNKSKNNVTLVTNVVVKALGLPLSVEAQRIEDLYAPSADAPFKVAS